MAGRFRFPQRHAIPFLKRSLYDPRNRIDTVDDGSNSLFYPVGAVPLQFLWSAKNFFCYFTDK
jgi:hypothetical protein